MKSKTLKRIKDNVGHCMIPGGGDKGAFLGWKTQIMRVEWWLTGAGSMGNRERLLKGYKLYKTSKIWGVNV